MSGLSVHTPDGAIQRISRQNVANVSLMDFILCIKLIKVLFLIFPGCFCFWANAQTARVIISVWRLQDTLTEVLARWSNTFPTSDLVGGGLNFPKVKIRHSRLHTATDQLCGGGKRTQVWTSFSCEHLTETWMSSRRECLKMCAIISMFKLLSHLTLVCDDKAIRQNVLYQNKGAPFRAFSLLERPWARHWSSISMDPVLPDPELWSPSERGGRT